MENRNALVSIIVPCYNYAQFLPETLNSVLEQEYTNWECIIVDDGSTDHTASVVALYEKQDRRFRYIHQVNAGLSSARNTGILSSKGIYLQFLDSDDKIDHSKIKVQVELLNGHDGVDIVYGNSLFFFSESPSLFFHCRNNKGNNRKQKLKRQCGGKEALPQLLINNIMEVSCALIKKTVVEKIGVFNETLRSYEDWEFWIRCATGSCTFYYAPVKGTETYIRCGHYSMMSDKKKLNEAGIGLRKFIQPCLSSKQKYYNSYRLAKLYLRRFLKLY